MRYRVKAMKAGEGVVSLSLDARDAVDARDQASGKGYSVLSVQGGGAAGVRLPGLGRKQKFPLVMFTQELLALLESGISLVEAIETLGEKESRPENKQVLSRLLESLYEGKPFSSAVQFAPQSFPELYVSTVRASERTGDLPHALKRYVAYQQQLDSVRKAIISASIYPVMLISVSLLVMMFLLGYVVPRFSHVYEDMGSNLPFMSRLLMHWGQWVEANSTLAAILLIVSIAAPAIWLSRPSAKATLLGLLRRIPSMGERIRVYQLTRFYRTLGMLLSGGIAVVPAIGMVSGLLDPELKSRLEGAQRAIREGQPISLAMEKFRLTTPVALRMLRVGERTGQMGEMMERIAVFHEEAMARWVETFTRAVGPLLMIVMGLMIGGIVVLMYLPIFQLAEGLQ